MGKQKKPSGVGRFNSDMNQLLLDKNFDVLFAGTNLWIVENADPNESEIGSFDAWLVEFTDPDYSWWRVDYTLDTGLWTGVDEDADQDFSQIKDFLYTVTTNSMNVPLSGAEVTAIKTMTGITP